MFHRGLKLFGGGLLLCLAQVCGAATPNISFGPLDTGLNDGTAPFGQSQYDATGAPIPCTSETSTELVGADCGENNRVLRTQDIASHLWSISVNGGDASIPSGEAVLTDVVIEQTIHPSPTADISFASLPAACREDAGGGTNPPSAIVVNSDGSSTLTCNLGAFSEGQGRIFTIGVKAAGTSENGSSYTSTQRVYSLDADGNENATKNEFVDNTPVMISAAPAYDLIHSVSTTQSIYNYTITSRDVGQGLERGFIAYMHYRLAAGRRTGVESINQPIVFKDVFTATKDSSSGPTYPLEFYITQCTPNPTAWGAETMGRMGIRSDYPDSKHVLDSGTCSYVRDDPSDPTSTEYTVTISGVDLSGDHYPTATIGGTDLSAGPYYVMNHRVQIFIPFRSVDLTDEISGNNTGAVYLSSLLKDFDPVSPSGVENYSGAKEPGYNGALIDNARSNNQLGATEFKLIPKGSFSKRNLKYTNNAVTSYAYSGTSSYHAGDGELEAGQSNAGWVLVYNQGTVGFNNPIACDIFDNTVQTLTDRGDVGASSGTYAFMGTYAPNGFDYKDYTIEYANIDLTGDDPLNGDGVAGNDYDVVTGRYNGTWAKQSAARCDDDSPSDGQWYTDPTQVPGGIDGVNAARAVLSTAAKAEGMTFEPGHQIRFVTPLRALDRFNGGPHDGEIIPVGTVLANFGSFKSDEWASGWTSRSYTPAPETSSVDGDRVTLTRISMQLDSHSISPVAESGSTATTLAGNQIIWQIDTAVQSTLAEPGYAENLKIIDVLPPSVSYNHSCTIDYEGGTPAGQVQYNTDANGNTAAGYTRLVWELGDYKANTVIPPRIICTDSDSLAEDGTDVINYAEIQADNVLSSLAARSDTHTISLEQIGEIQVSKSVDVSLDDRNDEQVYTLSWANFSAAIKIAAPVAIDILPFNGDEVLNRSPASSFSGVLELVGAPTTTWQDGSTPATTELAIGTWYYTEDDPTTIKVDPDNNTSNWCLEVDFGDTNCPTNFSDVTGLKFISNYALEKDGNPRQGMKAKVTLKAGDSADSTSGNANKSGDIYTNRFSLDSSTLPAAQFFESGNSTVQIASYSIGDFVFADIDGDGKYDENIDYPAPTGVKVNLRKSDGTLVKSTTIGTKELGRYFFNVLDSGSYYVEIPASEFQNDALLEHWTASVLSTSENDDNDEGDDQHAYSSGTPATTGIRTGLMTLSATPAVPGGIPLGNEPLGDNTAFLSDPTGDDFSNFTLDMGLKPDVYEVTGTVWNDANNNGLRESSEVGISGVTVVLYGSPWGDKHCLSVDTDANGYYKFDKVMSGTYKIYESDQSNVPFGSATCPPEAGDPATYTSTTSNVRTITVYEADIRRQDFGDYNGIIIRGTVFDDNGRSSGTSANASQDGGEKGISGIKVVATDASGNVYDTARTKTDGSYVLYVPGTASTVKVREYNASGYETTGADVGNSGGSYSASADVITFTAVSASEYVGLDFGDIQKPIFEPNNRGEILPGNVVFYAHKFTSPAGGDVSFIRVGDLSKSAGWASLLYHDSNCDGILNGAEGQSALDTQAIVVDAGESVCIIDKVYAPSNVAPRDQYRVTTTAVFNFGGSNLELTVSDITIASQVVTPSLPASPAVTAIPATSVAPAQPAVAASPVTPEVGPSRLELRKSVKNITKNTAETQTSNHAEPGDILEYRIYYSNTGTGPITELQVNDTAPAFTEFVLGSGGCSLTPSGMTCVPVMGVSDIQWNFTGSLQGGESGNVSYRVSVDD